MLTWPRYGHRTPDKAVPAGAQADPRTVEGMDLQPDHIRAVAPPGDGPIRRAWKCPKLRSLLIEDSLGGRVNNARVQTVGGLLAIQIGNPMGGSGETQVDVLD